MSLQEKIKQLSHAHQEQLLEKLRQHQAQLGPSLNPNNTAYTSLSGFIVLDDKTLSKATIESQLRERLPAYMIPKHLNFLEVLPYTHNGKVDKAKLAQFSTTSEKTDSQAQIAKLERIKENASEKILTIWQNVLGNPALQVDSNFFQSGGDSILAISLVSQMKKNNFNVTVSQLFKYSTVSTLASAIEEEGEAEEVGRSSQNLLNVHSKLSHVNSENVSFTPIQYWFFENDFQNPDHWNQSLLLEITPDISFQKIKQGFISLYKKHEAFRLAIKRQPTHITQVANEFSELNLPIQHIVLEGENDSTTDESIINSANQHHRQLKLADGRLLRGTFFSSGAGTSGRLLLVAHHFCVDAVSWRIIVDELNDCLGSPEAFNFIAENNDYSVFQRWSNSLQQFANSESFQQSYIFWKNQEFQFCPKIPYDFGNSSLNTEDSSRSLQVSISERSSQALLAKATGQNSATVQMLILTALSLALKEWLHSDHLLIGIEGHGREDIDAALQPDSVVGWLTSYFPLVLDLQYIGSAQQALNEVQQQFSLLPDKGLSFGMGRYLAAASEYQDELAQLPAPEIIFNYLGRAVSNSPEEQSVKILKDTIGVNRDPQNSRASVFEINAFFEDKKLIIKWQFSHKLHKPETVQKLLDTVSDKLNTLASNSLLSGGLTETEGQLRYPLSEVQQGFVLHRLSNLNSDQGELLLRGELHGRLSLQQFTNAWQTLISRHTALRSTIDWKNQDLPYLIVHPESHPTIEFSDLSNLSSAEQNSPIQQLITKKQNEPIDIESLPGMNFTLIKNSDTCHTFLWACHHLFLDGWSSSIVLTNLLEILAGKSHDSLASSNLEDYYHYIDSLVISNSGKFWQSELVDCSKCLISNEFKVSHDSHANSSRTRVTTQFNQEAMNDLKLLAMDLKVTPSVILAGCWSLVLANLTQLHSVCFGLTLSGRNYPIKKVQSLVGNLANIVPFKVAIDLEKDLQSWLEELLLSQEAVANHSQFSTGQIMSWSGHDSNQVLFDTVLAIANYPKITSSGAIKLNNYKGDATTIHPLSISIIMDEQLSFTFDYASNMFTPECMDFIVDLYYKILGEVKAKPRSKLQLFVNDATSQAYKELVVRGAVSAVIGGMGKPARRNSSAVQANLNSPKNSKQNHTEQVLLSILKDVLEIDACQIDDSFFDLGGSSLQAIKYFNRIENTFHKTLPMSFLFMHPTVELLAKLIDDEAANISRFKNLVKINSGSDLPPIFLIHAAGLDILFYKDLAKRFDSKIPLYGLLPVGHDGSEKPLFSVEKMAERYIAEIKSVYPVGPYILLGHCFGFTIAYEMASKLIEENAEVPLVISIDGPAPLPLGYVDPDWVAPLQRTSWEILQGIGRITERFFQRGVDFLIDCWLLKLKKGTVEQRTELLAKRSEHAFGMANSTYRAKPVEAKILAFHCLDSDQFEHHTEAEWLRMVPDAILVKADCCHHEVLVEPYVQQTAAVIADHLQSIVPYKGSIDPLKNQLSQDSADYSVDLNDRDS